MAVAGLLTATSGCTSAPDAPKAAASPSTAGAPAGSAEPVSAPRERACEGGTYTWFNEQSLFVLNGVSDVQRVTGKRTKLTEPVRRLRTDQASVEAVGPRLDSRDVLFALSVRLGFADKGGDPQDGSGLGEPGTYAPLDEGGGEVGGHTARLVNFSFVKLVETDFRYTCGSGKGQEPTTGHVVTWGNSGGGVVDCDEALPKDASAAAHEAVRLSCGR
ncbi:hypothetical protein [Streptomyces sp. ITFR-16]|uniref:hypothetical protein n=1 Tax=Streptomyces sp. ITFR-16 TaxID=3075198 RepID=UPI00288925F3|nr:hypothetical protein [Streptomyces sp. ITFR-16]WNI22672.1 hypothetical protein RLT58_12360 [Streptomyces sp. ITFR-16]